MGCEGVRGDEVGCVRYVGNVMCTCRHMIVRRCMNSMCAFTFVCERGVCYVLERKFQSVKSCDVM